MQMFRDKMKNLHIAKPGGPIMFNGSISWCAFYDKYEIVPDSIIGEVRKKPKLMDIGKSFYCEEVQEKVRWGDICSEDI